LHQKKHYKANDFLAQLDRSSTNNDYLFLQNQQHLNQN